MGRWRVCARRSPRLGPFEDFLDGHPLSSERGEGEARVLPTVERRERDLAEVMEPYGHLLLLPTEPVMAGPPASR